MILKLKTIPIRETYPSHMGSSVPDILEDSVEDRLKRCLTGMGSPVLFLLVNE